MVACARVWSGPTSRGAGHILRVLLVAARYPPSLGGTEIHTREIARRLPAFGIEPTVLTTQFGRGLVERDEERVPVIRVRAWPPNRDLYFAPRVASQVFQRSWDVIHLHGVHTLVAPFALAAAAASPAPYVVTLHSGGHSSVLRNALRPAWWLMLRPLVARASAIVAVSEFEADLFARSWNLPRSRFEVIPSGVTMPLEAAETRDHPVVVSLGRLERYKGHERLVTAFPLVLQDIPEARLLLIGGGREERRLRKLIDSLGLRGRADIISVPADERRRLAELLSSAALVVSLSRYESQGMAVMEALALGRPVVVLAATALAELSREGLARPVDPNAGVDEIAAVVVDELRHPRKPPAVPLPTWEEATTRLAELYARVAARRPLQQPS